MSIGSFIKKVFASPAGHAVATVAGTALTQAVAAAAQKGNPIGDAAIAAVAAAESTTLAGDAKRAQVVAAIKPAIVSVATSGGLSTIVTDVEQFAGMVVEEVVAAVKQTPIVALASALLKALGVKL